MKIKKGTTRIVILIGNIAIKIPNISLTYGFNMITRGIISNTKEYNNYIKSKNVDNDKSYLLCPIIACLLYGCILIMKRVNKVLQDSDLNQYDISEHKKYFEGDDMGSNYGILNNRLVKIDYAN